ncbi:hypothetical protein IWX90DRAFT_84566 [Phyllosticta citrichinensis]|uniref:Secreted protein n=1 Tax=Phyllosticta citrichinensis TaxID=1130410 RepID=A0ABR1XFR0_9PEZI
MFFYSRTLCLTSLLALFQILDAALQTCLLTTKTPHLSCHRALPPRPSASVISPHTTPTPAKKKATSFHLSDQQPTEQPTDQPKANRASRRPSSRCITIIVIAGAVG